MINQMIIQQECQRRSITVSEAEVEQEVARVAKQFNLPLDAWYKMLEAERGLNRQQYHEDVIWPMLALKKLAGTDVQVTEQDMQIGFERDYGPRMKGRMILFEGNSRQAGEIWEKCQAAPDDFDRLAREFSADRNTRPLGGVIPPIRRHGGNPQVEAAAFKLQPGEISAVIQVAEKQYVILKCEGFTDPVVQDIKVVWNDLYSQLVEEKTQVAVAKVFSDIKQKAVVHNFLTRQTSGTPVTPVSGQRAPGAAIVPAGAATR
jgi:foldase protein PrsA